jgi:DNA adenine methylase
MSKKVTNQKVAASNDSQESIKAFGYYGCKQRLSSRIVTDLPPHNAWVEASCGSAAVTLAKEPAPIEVINDLDGEIVNFFRQLRGHTTKLTRQILLTPYSRQELENSRAPVDGISDIEKARRFFVRAMMAINGSFGDAKGGFSFSNSYSRRGKEARVSRWGSTIEQLGKVAARLRNVRIENRDALKLFKDFADRPATLVYFDLPYLGDRLPGYEVDETSIEYHERLLVSAIKAKCMIFISGYENELYDTYLTENRGWDKRLIETTTRGHNGKDADRIEVIWSNKPFQRAVASGRVPIRLSAREKKLNKINPKRK